MLWSHRRPSFSHLGLKLLGRVDSSLLVGYPLMIAASGLWFRIILVWFTTGLSIVCYPCSILTSWSSDSRLPAELAANADWQYPNIFVASLAITGFVIARSKSRIEPVLRAPPEGVSRADRPAGSRRLNAGRPAEFCSMSAPDLREQVVEAGERNRVDT